MPTEADETGSGPELLEDDGDQVPGLRKRAPEDMLHLCPAFDS